MCMTFLNNGQLHIKEAKATFVTTRMALDGMMLNKSDRERHTLYILTYMWNRTKPNPQTRRGLGGNRV